LIESWGRGIERIFAECKDAGIPVPELRYETLEACPRSIAQVLPTDRARTLFTPHLGWSVDDVCRKIALEAVENVLDVFAGRKPRGAMNDVGRSPADWQPQATASTRCPTGLDTGLTLISMS